MRFLKMHGLGNDFAILDHRNGGVTLVPAVVQAMADRHRGVGCDQVVVMEPSDKADFFVRFYNADGSQSGACGNATRCVADIYMKEKGVAACQIETPGGVLEARRAGDLITVDMGAPGLDWRDIPLAAECDTLNLPIGMQGLSDAVAVSMGNPHCVFFVDDVAGIDVEGLGPVYEHHIMFPARTNVEFAQVRADGSLRVRVWERGAGVTLACGTGACAVAVAAMRRGLVSGRRVDVEMDGGILDLEWRERDNHVLMSGSVSYVYEGTYKNNG